MRISDWSSDVCSSDLKGWFFLLAPQEEGQCFDKLSTNGRKDDADLTHGALNLSPLPVRVERSRDTNGHRGQSEIFPCAARTRRIFPLHIFSRSASEYPACLSRSVKIRRAS